jgi:ribosomal protein S18 acetylase RimI-like enzyme
MIIRDYRQEDFLQVENLWKETGIFRPERCDTHEIILRCNSQGGKFLILEDEINNRIIGTSWLTWDGRRVLMQYFALLPTLQGLGYGRKLALESLAFSRNKKAPMKLEVHHDNIPAIQLYKNLGFKVLEGYEVYKVLYDA